MKLCLSEDQVTISFQHREVLKVCSHTECHLDPAWLANACLVNTDFSSDAASRVPERGLKLQSWAWCFLWDGQKEPFEKDQKRWTHYRRLFWGWEMNNKEAVFSWGLEMRALFPLYLYRSFVALKGSSYSGWETTLLLRPAAQLAAPWDIGFLGAAQLCTKVHSGLRGKVLELPMPKPKELLPAHVSTFPRLSPPSSTAWEPVSEPEKGTWRRRREEKGREGGRDETRKVKTEQSEKEEINSRIEIQKGPVQNLHCIWLREVEQDSNQYPQRFNYPWIIWTHSIGKQGHGKDLPLPRAWWHTLDSRKEARLSTRQGETMKPPQRTCRLTQSVASLGWVW